MSDPTARYKMHIVFIMHMRIATIYLGRRGGGNLYTFYLAKAIQRIIGVKQRLFLQGNMENLRMFKKEWFDIQEFGTFDKGVLDFVKIPFRLAKLKRAIEKFDPEIIYVPMFNPYIPFLFKLFPNVKKIYTLHGVTSRGGRTRTVLENRWQEQAITSSDYVITLSRHYQKWMKKRFPKKKTFLLPHPVFEYYSQLGKGRMVQGEYILFIGRVGEKYKGFDIMQQAFEHIRRKVPLKLVVAGKQERPSKIRGGRYRFKDKWLSDSEFASLIRHAWVVCLPYTEPTPSGVVAAALALHRPIVASDLPGLNEQIVHGKNGILVPAGKMMPLAGALEKLYSDKHRYARLERGAEAMAEQFSVRSISRKLAPILKEVRKA